MQAITLLVCMRASGSKDFMDKTLTKKLNAWQYEVALTNMARQLNARCADSRRGEFPILDVIRKERC